MAEIVRYARQTGASIEALYDAGTDLGHYGEVDHLAPAGAMSDFVAYVREQSLREAEEAFAPLRAAAESLGLRMTVRVLHERSSAADRLRGKNAEKAADRVFVPQPAKA